MHVYELCNDEPGMEIENDDDSHTPMFQEWTLPNQQFENIWESLIFDDECMKLRLIRYMQTALHFSDAGVSSDIITFNRYHIISYCLV